MQNEQAVLKYPLKQMKINLACAKGFANKKKFDKLPGQIFKLVNSKKMK